MNINLEILKGMGNCSYFFLNPLICIIIFCIKNNMEFKNVVQFLNDFGKELADKYQRKLVNDDAVSSGKLLNSIKYIFKKNNTSYEISMEMAEYWKYVENGRKSGKFPPISAIREWVKIKPVIPRPYNGKLPTENQLAFLIARSIANKGIRPKPIFNDTLDDAMNDFENGLEDAFTKDIENEMDKITVLLTTYK